MRPPGIIVTVNVLKDSKLKFSKGMINPSVGLLFFEIFEEAFTTGIIKRVAFLGEGMDYIKLIKELLKSKSCILRTPVRVEHKAIGSVSFIISKLKGSHNKVDISLRRQMPGNDLPGEKIHDYAKIVPFTVSFKVSKVAGPNDIWSLLRERLGKKVFKVGCILGAISLPGPVSRHLREFKLIHQAVHSAYTDVDAIITF